MRRHLPSLSALQCFEAAARHLSFTRAAAELCITQSAVSRQIRALEDYVGVRLFQRTRQRLVLTPDGATYLAEIRTALDRMEAATLQLLANQGGGGVLAIAVLPTFGTRWLIPRLPSFHEQNPGIGINLTTRTGMFDLEAENIDVAIHFGEANWPNAVMEPLMGEEVVPVCSPSLLSRLERPEDLRNQTLLQHATRPGAWKAWLEATGVTGINGLKGPKFEHFMMVVQAAIAGLGVAVMPSFLVAEDIAAQRLVVPPFARPIPSESRYYVVCPEAKADVAKVKAFRAWVRHAASLQPA